jgi:hypothetical protein
MSMWIFRQTYLRRENANDGGDRAYIVAAECLFTGLKQLGLREFYASRGE